jgi:exodeoxyribonuclease V alpha subunit
LLQESLNPGSVSIKYGGAFFRPNDKVMQIKNNYDKNVFNGDIGIISNIDTENRIISINFEGNMVDYDTTELDEIIHAYATTVHKSQGSEFKIVVAPIAIQHYMMLQRNLLYTCVTRAKKILVLVGTKKAVGIAVSNDSIRQRNTLLAKRLAAGQ